MKTGYPEARAIKGLIVFLSLNGRFTKLMLYGVALLDMELKCDAAM